MGALRDAWFAAADAAAQKQIGAELQMQAFEDAPYLPLGMSYQPTVQQKNLTGCLKSLPIFGTCEEADNGILFRHRMAITGSA